MQTKTKTLILAMLVAATAVPHALSATPDQPCRDDILSHCGERIGDREAMRQCMRDKFGEFTQQCQNAIMDRMREREQATGPGPDGTNTPPSPGQSIEL